MEMFGIIEISILTGLCVACISAICVYFTTKIRKKKRRTSQEQTYLSQRIFECEQQRDFHVQHAHALSQKIDTLHVQLQESTNTLSAKQAEIGMLATFRSEFDQQRIHIERLIAENSHLKTMLEKERTQAEEKMNLLLAAEVRLEAQFKTLSKDIMHTHSENFLKLADEKLRASMEHSKIAMTHSLTQKEQAITTLLDPIKNALSQVDTKIHAMEKERVGAYENLQTQVHHLIVSQKDLRTETGNLVKALRAPHVRGKWGEMQLKKVVEMAGMVSHCDFVEQSSMESEDGARMRPDMVIRLPGGSVIVVDAKAPLAAYLDAVEAPDEPSRLLKLQDHARQVRAHIRALSQRAYTDQFEKSPDFVVLFLPGEMFFSAALEQDPELLEYGFRDKVILATPTTLIALLRAVAYGWRQESLAENARAIAELGKELSKRIHDMAEHFAKMGKNLSHMVENYNATVGTFERRVLVTARKFKDLDATCEEVENIPEVTHLPRILHAV